MKIIGAGLAGCLAGVLIPNSTLYEPSTGGKTHEAILRFRTNAIAEATGIKFKKIKIYKGIWHNDRPVALSPRYISLYSRKVSDTIAHRSICNLDPEERFVAPDNFHDILKDQLKGRIEYGVNLGEALDEGSDMNPIISTIPLHVAAELLAYDFHEPNVRFSSIYVNKYALTDCDAYMTYYYTDPTTTVYRASLNGNELIIESTLEITKEDYKMVKRSMGLSGLFPFQTLENYIQKMGKIVPIDDDLRKELIYNMTKDYGVYSLGRFATWRNLILDDVFKDIQHIKEMINKSNYDRCIK